VTELLRKYEKREADAYLYSACKAASEEWTVRAKGADVLAWLDRRFPYLVEPHTEHANRRALDALLDAADEAA